MAKENRFQKIHGEGLREGVELLLDTETGVQYLFYKSGYAGGLTPLLDADGKPIITPAENNKE